MIVQLRQDTMRGDYARVLHKLAEVLKKQGNGELKAYEKEIEAQGILSNLRLENSGRWPALIRDIGVEGDSASGGRYLEDSSPPLTGIEGERPYDALVYIHWR